MNRLLQELKRTDPSSRNRKRQDLVDDLPTIIDVKIEGEGYSHSARCLAAARALTSPVMEFTAANMEFLYN